MCARDMPNWRVVSSDCDTLFIDLSNLHVRYWTKKCNLNGRILNGAVATGIPVRQIGVYRLLQWQRGRNQIACGCLSVSGNSFQCAMSCFPSDISPGAQNNPLSSVNDTVSGNLVRRRAVFAAAVAPVFIWKCVHSWLTVVSSQCCHKCGALRTSLLSLLEWFVHI